MQLIIHNRSFLHQVLLHIIKEDGQYILIPGWARFVAFLIDRRISATASRCFKFELFGCRSSGKQSTESFKLYKYMQSACLGSLLYGDVSGM